jgi:hypothetical protein
MGLLSPWWLLAGALGAALPIWLHLLQQHKQDPFPFASTMFFERRTESTTYQRRLKYKFLMALRIALLLLLAFAFAQPFLRRPPAILNASNALSIVVVDNSFSMREGGRLEDAKGKARSALPMSGDAQVWALGSRVALLSPVTKDKGELQGAINSIGASDEKSNFADLARSLRDTARSTGRALKVTFITDAQRTALPPSFADLALENGTDFKVVEVGRKLPNYTVETVNAPRTSGDLTKAKVSAVVTAFNAPAAKLNVTLKINGKPAGTKAIEVPENGRATVEFTGFEGPYGWLRGEVEINEADALAADNRFYFATERADPRKVLYITEQQGTRAALYFRAALEAGAQALFQLEELSPAAAANANLTNYAFAVLNDPGSSASGIEDKLKKYVEGGGAVFIAAGPKTAALAALPVAALKVDGSRVAQRGAERYFTAAQADPTYPSLRRSGRLDGVRFFEAVKIEAASGPGLIIAAKLEDGSPLLLEKKIGEGKAVILASSLDNVTNDFPVKPGFVPFVEQTAAYLGRVEDKTSSYPVDSYLDLREDASRKEAVEVLGPKGERALTLKESASASSLRLGEAGFFEVRRGSGREELIAVNVDRRESDLDPVSRENLALWEASGKGNARAAGHDAPQQQGPDAEAQSFWWWIALLAALTLAAEQVFSARYLESRA